MFRDELRALPALIGRSPDFDTTMLPPDPRELFVDWFRAAVDAAVPEPHATTLSTVDDDGMPDARVLLLKDLTPEGWWFASEEGSAKGRQLAANPRAALTFYWSGLGRSVRIRGHVERGSDARAAHDQRERGIGARAVGLVGRSGAVVGAADADREIDAAIDAALRRIRDAGPEFVDPGWRVWVVHAGSVEFWQAHPERRHVRVRYERAGEGWAITRLWP
ncbi:pyridoxal 5'-phosphate synthase [Agromyces sp. NPDC049794]|uniref:pyridoxine/pyridoxamine 5'-phosphate oxidase n=1 Tax=unclassified Agromyces TaxID=2639701 RepID=UPI0034066EF1